MDTTQFFRVTLSAAVCSTFLGCAPALLGDMLRGAGGASALYGLSYPTDAIAVPQGTAMTAITPSFAAGSATSWSISPGLPTGMSIDSSTGVISGTPTTTTPDAATSSFTTYTVTATNSLGSTSYPIKLLVPSTGIVVTSNAWTADGTPANGICEAPCTLRGAIQTLNGAGSAAQTMILIGAGTYSVSATLAITKNTLSNVVICGVDPTTTIIDGASARQIFTTYTGGTPLNLTFCNLTLQNGYLASDYTGGAIDFEQTVDGGSLNLSNVIVKGTTSIAAGSNTGAAVYIGNGGSPTNTTVNIERTTFLNNAGYNAGGGLTAYASGAKVITLNVSNSYFSGNSSAAGTGGGMLMDKTITTVTQTTFANNSAAVEGGAIGFWNNNTFTITNSTFFANTASGSGGAIYVPNSTTTGNVRLSTFVNNAATTASGGGAIAMSGGAVTLTSTGNLFSGNTANASAHHCRNTGSVITNAGYNAFTTAGSSCGGASGNDVSSASVGVDTTLALNGGEFVNLALQAGSPALGIVPSGVCSGFASVDTRDFARSGACDAGAFEY